MHVCTYFRILQYAAFNFQRNVQTSTTKCQINYSNKLSLSLCSLCAVSFIHAIPNDIYVLNLWFQKLKKGNVI